MQMIKRHQLYRHEPHNGIYGDCYRSTIACLLGIEPHKVPHWYQLNVEGRGGDTYKEARLWLAERGFSLATVSYSNIGDPAFVDYMSSINRDVVYMLSGKSPRGNWSHVVIAKNGKIIWDCAKPCPTWGQLDGPCPYTGMYEIEYLVPLIHVPE